MYRVSGYIFAWQSLCCHATNFVNTANSLSCVFSLQFLLYTILVYDKFQNGIPVCHFVMEKCKTENLIVFLMVVKQKLDMLRLQLGLPPWQPNCWLIDVAGEKIAALGWDILPIPTPFYTFWLGQHAYYVNYYVNCVTRNYGGKSTFHYALGMSNGHGRRTSLPRCPTHFQRLRWIMSLETLCTPIVAKVMYCQLLVMFDCVLFVIVARIAFPSWMTFLVWMDLQTCKFCCCPSWTDGEKLNPLLLATTRSGTGNSKPRLSNFECTRMQTRIPMVGWRGGHHTLKQELEIDKYNISVRTLIWLILRIATLENHYYCMDSLKYRGRIKNRTIKKYVWESIHKA